MSKYANVRELNLTYVRFKFKYVRSSGWKTEATRWFKHRFHIRKLLLMYVNWGFSMIDVRELNCHVRVLEFNEGHVRKTFVTYVRMLWQCIKCAPFQTTTATIHLTTVQNQERGINTCLEGQKHIYNTWALIPNNYQAFKPWFSPSYWYKFFVH